MTIKEIKKELEELQFDILTNKDKKIIINKLLDKKVKKIDSCL